MTARFKDLTKKEKQHLREMGITTRQQFVKNAAEQKAEREQARARVRARETDSDCYDPYRFWEPCWDCRAIAKKLGLPV